MINLKIHSIHVNNNSKYKYEAFEMQVENDITSEYLYGKIKINN